MASSTRPGALDVSKVFKLIIEDDEGKTIVFPLTEGETTIGRHEVNTIRLMERNISRKHARITSTHDGVFIEDLDSYIGTRLNGERVEFRRKIAEGDLLEIGDYHIALRSSDTADEELAAQVTQALPVESLTVSDGPVFLPDQPMQLPVEAYRLPDELLSEAKLGTDGSSDDSTIEEHAREVGLDTIPERRRLDGNGHMGDVVSNLPPFPESPLEAMGALSSPKPESAANVFAGEPSDPFPVRGKGLISVSDVPRLICVSTKYAGQAYEINAEELTVGRVDDNDIVIEHPSVSRNHAKLVLHGDAYHVHDLKSANGILVNGSEHPKARLKPNDLIELGSVRFRYIPAGEPFQPHEEEIREMRANGIEPPAMPRKPITVQERRSSTKAGGGVRLPARTGSILPRRRGDTGAQSAPAESRSQSLRRRPASASRRPPTSDGRSVRDDEYALHVATTPPRSAGQVAIGLSACLLLVVVVLLAWLVLFPGQLVHDRKLDQMFAAGRYDEVKRYFEAHEGEFEHPIEAATLFSRALNRLDAPEFDSPSADAPSLNIEGSQEYIVDSGVRQRSEDKAPNGSENQTQLSQAARSRRATVLFRQGQDALNVRDLGDAEAHLTECTRVAPNFAMCHMALGMLYAASSPQRALRHYKKFLELAPDADDADHVRAMIKTVEGDIGQ
ncbi:MAG: FHA domain-containing protein [Myxococcales bacterium]|nr:FHA domain-containing protein [Myxococcales bacterium]